MATGTGKTGKTGHRTLRFVEAKRPWVVVLENAKTLGTANVGLIMEALAGWGYVAVEFVHDAANYGSACKRATQHSKPRVNQ